jgi:hypothetical protein
MRKPLLAAVLAAALLTPALVTAGPAGAASFTACGGSYGPDGTPGAGFYRKIKAKRITCTAAKKVVLKWIKSHADGTDNPTTKVKVLGYSCSGKATQSASDPDGGLSVLCVSGRKAVSFYGHP